MLAEITTDLGVGEAWGGVVTALPSISFGVFGAIAVWLAGRLGLRRTLTLGAIAICVGYLGRTILVSPNLFIGFSVLAFAGAALGNVLVPAFVKRRFPHDTARMISVYTVVLALGSMIPAALVVPIAHRLPGGWRPALGVWGLLAAVAIIPMVALAVIERSPGARPKNPSVPLWALLGSRQAVALAIFLGMQSLNAFTQFGWLAQIYRDGGVSQAEAGLLGSFVAGCGIVASLVMPAVVFKISDVRPLTVGFGVLLIVGYAGLWLAPDVAPWLWALLLGMSGAAFPTALALMTERTRDPNVTAALSGMSQTLGYALSALGPLLVGIIRAATGAWLMPLALLAATGVIMAVSGWIAGGQECIDDQLSPRGKPDSD